jgi:very-short-patch-repair endonuclease
MGDSGRFGKPKPLSTKIIRDATERMSESTLRRFGIPDPMSDHGFSSRAQESLRILQAKKAQEAADAVRSTFSLCEPSCESEIEKLFLIALMAQDAKGCGLQFLPPVFWQSDPQGFLSNSISANGSFGIVDTVDPKTLTSDAGPVFVLQQFPIAQYRADFLLYGIAHTQDRNGERQRFRLVVECDGHDHHERTKEQAERDRKRDRAMLMLGFQVMRFTGSELWRDADRCAEEALTHIREQQNAHVTLGFGGAK